MISYIELLNIVFQFVRGVYVKIANQSNGIDKLR